MPTPTPSPTPTDPPTPQPIIDQTATGEVRVAGSVAGNYVDTLVNDLIAESITENISGGAVKKSYSYLEHKWVFNVQPGVTVTLFANAWAPASSDGDAFFLSYSTDDANYSYMFAVTEVGDNDNYQTFLLPNNLSGTVFLRVKDTDHTPGNRTIDTVYVDHLFIRTETVPLAPPGAPTGLAAVTASSSQIDLSWMDNSDNETGYHIERSLDDVNWARIETVGPDVTAYVDTGLLPETRYYYRVQAYNSGGTSGYSNTASALTDAASTVHVSDLDGAGVAGRRWEAWVTITVEDTYANPVSGATVTGDWSSGVSGSGSCMTNASGQCSVALTNIKSNNSSVTFTVTKVEHAWYTYDPASNTDPDGDSDGTVIVVSMPQ
jgi:hypothetical protein